MTHESGKRPERIVVISNPASGHNRKAFDGFQHRIAGTSGLQHFVTRNAAQADRIVETLQLEASDVLVINGGDGTAAHIFGLVLTHWPDGARPLLMVLPGGTANMTAGDLGIASNACLGERRFLRWLAEGCPLDVPQVERSVLKVKFQPKGQTHYGMFLGTGAIMQGTRFAHDSVHSRGLGGQGSLGLVLLRTLWGLTRQDPAFCRGVTTRLAVNQVDNGRPDVSAPIKRPDRELLVLAASTLERLFLGIRPFWAKGSGSIGLTTVRFGAPRFVSTFISIICGRPNQRATSKNGYESYRTNSFHLWQDGALNLDGELIEAERSKGPVTVNAEGPLRFLRPR